MMKKMISGTGKRMQPKWISKTDCYKIEVEVEEASNEYVHKRIEIFIKYIMIFTNYLN